MVLKKILGLDIGTTSVGWAVSKELKSGEWTIDDFGVRIFNEPVEIKKSASFASERRVFRSKRRLTRRKIRRIRDLKYFLEKYSNGSITKDEIQNHFKKLNDKNLNKNYKYSNDVNPYFIRRIAVEGKPITWLQFAIALINIAKRRGYDDSFITKFNNSEEIKNDDSYSDKINLGRKLINEYKFPIIALENLKIFINGDRNNQTFNKEYKHVKNTIPRSNSNKSKTEFNKKSHDFFYFSRADYFNEVKEIIRQQKEHLNLSQDLIKRLIGDNENEDKKLSIIFRQRPFEDGPGDSKDEKRKYKGFSKDNVGNDIFLNEKRMWSSLIINDLFILLVEISKINILEIIKNEDLIKFNQNLILKYFDFIFKDAKTFKKEFQQIASIFNISKENIDIKISENFKFSSLFINRLLQFVKDDFLKKEINEIKEFVFNKNKNFNSIETNNFTLDKFGNLIAENITPWVLLKKLKEDDFYNKFDENKIDNYLNKESNKNKIQFKDLDEKINYVVSKFSTSPSKVSYKYACMALNAFIFEGKRYGEFQSEFNKNIIDKYNSILKSPFGPICDPDVAHNPMVMRALSQARKVVKELYKEYKWFDSIVVESARELTSSLKDRRKIKDKQDKNNKENSDISIVLNQHKLRDNSVNKRKMKLYYQQKGFSIYSGKPIDISRLDDYEIDHIIPQSKINDNSFDNIVLVSKEENQIKKNRTPLEAGNELIQNIKSYESTCLKLKKEGLISNRKYTLLLSKSSNDESVKDVIKEIASRELNDTRYISKYFTNYLKKSIELYRKNNNEYQNYNFKVFNPTGSLTSRYRKIWLYGSAWGLETKTRNISHFHHAVDAMILSNMISENHIKFYTDCSRIWNLVKNRNKIWSEESKKELDDTYNEIIESWQKQNKLYGLWFPKWKERFEDIKNMKFSSFAQIVPPAVGQANFRSHVDERIPLKLRIEKNVKKTKDSNGNDISIISEEAKFERIIWEEEYNKEIGNLKDKFPDSNIRYPFISFKHNNKIRGGFTGSENYISKKQYNDPKTDKKSYRETEDGIINLSSYHGILIVKYPNQKKDFVRIRKLDIIEKFNFAKNKSQKINFKEFYNQFISPDIKESKGKIVGILQPGTIFKGFRDDSWKICLYRGVTSKDQISSPYIFVPLNSHKDVTGWIPASGPSYFSNIKILKIDILGRRIR